MRFVCNDCRRAMEFVDNSPSDDGSAMIVIYTCPGCGRGISMITNAGETQLVRSLGVTIGHENLSEAAPGPMAVIRGSLASHQAAASTVDGQEPVWTEAALKRLAAAPSFVQGMIRVLYTDYARQKGYAEITPAVMSEARAALGMAGM